MDLAAISVILYIFIVYLIRNSIRSIINVNAVTCSGKGGRRKTIQLPPVAPSGGDSGQAERSYATLGALSGWFVSCFINVVVGSNTQAPDPSKKAKQIHDKYGMNPLEKYATIKDGFPRFPLLFP